MVRRSAPKRLHISPPRSRMISSRWVVACIASVTACSPFVERELAGKPARRRRLVLQYGTHGGPLSIRRRRTRQERSPTWRAPRRELPRTSRVPRGYRTPAAMAGKCELSIRTTLVARDHCDQGCHCGAWMTGRRPVPRGAQSGRRRGHPRRPPTPPDVRIRIRRFLSTGQTAPASLRSVHRVACRSIGTATTFGTSGPSSLVAGSRVTKRLLPCPRREHA